MTTPEHAKKDKIRDKVFSTGNSLGFDNYEVAISSFNPPDFGLCSSCKNMQFARTEFRVRIAKCYDHELILSSSEPIVDCTNYEKIGALTLSSMWNMATLIDPPGRKIGFGEDKSDGEEGKENPIRCLMKLNVIDVKSL